METFDFRIINIVLSDPELLSIVTEFGDGYEQSSELGINSTIEMVTLELAFAAHQSTEHERFEAFARRHGSFRSFNWQAPWDTLKKWRIVTRTRKAKRSGNWFSYEHTVKLKQV